MNHQHRTEEVAVLMARYRARKMREHMMGPGVSFIFHMALLILLALFVNGYTPPPKEEALEITMTPPPEIFNIPVRREAKQIESIDELVPPVPPIPQAVTSTVSIPDTSNEPICYDMPTESDWEMPQIADIAPISSPLKLPGLYADRGEKRRRGMIKRGEMPAGGQDAVLRALRWLARVQMDNGSWERGPAVTGLALLCFLAHGDTPLSEEFGLTVQKSMQWLANAMPGDGRAIPGKHGGVYDHGIATYALCEGYAMTQIPMLRTAAANGLAVIIKGQQRAGGWNYNYDDKGRWDLSVSAWQMQALKAGYIAGLDAPGLCDAMDEARAFTLRAKKGGTFGYSSPGGSSNLTGAGTLCLQILGAGQSPAAQTGVDYVAEKRLAKFAAARNNWTAQGGPIYGWYYDTQAAFHAGGAHWKAWRNVFDRVLRDNQHADGYWDIEAAHSVGSPLADDVYHTTLCCLQLEVYYRYLPSLKLRGNCNDEVKVTNLLDDDKDDELIIQ
jgi:hypothetical protein